MIGELRVAHGDVPGAAHVEAVAGEQAEGAGQALLAQQALSLDRGLLRRLLPAEYGVAVAGSE